MMRRAGKTVVATVSMTLLAALIPFVTALPAAAAAECRSDSLSETDALRQAKACKSKVEILGLRTEKAKFFANPDGTQSFEIAATAKRVRKDGAWRDIDTTLKKEKDGRWAPKAAADVSFSNGGPGPFVVSNVDGKRFELSWPGTLPAPEIQGNTATYREILPGADLALIVTAEGYRHTLIVKTRAAAASPALAKVKYAMSGDARLRSTQQGELELADATGKALGPVSHASAMWDSAMDPALAGEVLPGVTPSGISVSTAAEPGPAAHVRQIAVAAQGDELTVTPDAELLKTGVLPLFIDPPLDRNKMGWAYANNTNSNWTPGEHARVGRNPDDGKLFRSFFEFSMSGIQGVQITYAAVGINLDHSSACGGNTAYLYRSDSVGGANGTRVAWSTGLQTGPLASAWGQSNEAGGCSGDQGDDWLVFPNLTGDVGYGSGQGWPTYTIGLCMCSNSSGSGESGTYQWMKFHHSTAVLAGTYNRPPGTPADLKTSGVACGGVVATNQPQLRAQYIDSDGDNTLNATFEWKELPSGGVNSVAGPAKPANNYGDVTLDLGAAAEGKSYSWRVITSDGIHGTQGVSPWCDFQVNTGPPPMPGVTSATYPNGSTPSGGPGIPGTFTLHNGGTAGLDVTTYFYGWSDPPAYSINVSPGATATVVIAPPRHGYNVLHVYSREPSGITSPTTHYSFLTNSPSAPVAHWPLDDIPGHGLDDQMGTRHLSGPNTSWTPDVRYVGSQGLTLHDGAKLSAANAVDTSKSFSVSAWVRLTDTSDQYNAIISQEGTNTSGFILYATTAKDAFGFVLYDGDNTSTNGTFVHGPAKIGVWTHLLATYDAAENQVRLWVNGQHAETRNRTGTPWNATGQVHVGWAKYSTGALMQKGIGNVADIRIWNRSASGDDIFGRNALPAQPATTGVMSVQEVGTWDFGDGDVLDGSYWSRHMTMEGNATFANPGHDSNGAFSLNATQGRAVTNGPVVRTDQPVTISAWVKADQYRTTNQIIARQNHAVNLYLDGNTNKWIFSVASPDGQGGYTWTGSQSNDPAVLGQWQHLIGVLDPASGQTRLYVSGYKQSSVGVNARGSYDPAVPFEVGAVNGVTDFFGGQIDQVKVFLGAMTDREARNHSGMHDLSVVGAASNRCLDLKGYGTANGTALEIFDCHGGGNQKFVLRADGTMFNPTSGRCLDAGNMALAYAIVLNDCHAGTNQIFQYRADGSLYMPHANMCLDAWFAGTANNTKIILYTCHGGGNQVFSDPARG
ncbi:LamG-like jellyroll fold domain-containing protein [Catelliglobosispora koreensis]|uniref:LamG-like jellyroll fold domain-containing protein n=1 Tax=Catelliglobosispora koreensis TaxID=129052 RepID=UPI00146BEAA3|nr:LamG-like jellyroll fold domain-containing protein [Catelliglobosispora koreensis]